MLLYAHIKKFGLVSFITCMYFLNIAIILVDVFIYDVDSYLQSVFGFQM